MIRTLAGLVVGLALVASLYGIAALAIDARSLRAELATVGGDLDARLDNEAIVRGQQAHAERTARRADAGRLSAETVAAVAVALREQDERRAADRKILARLAALEARKPAPCRCKPCPPPAPVVQSPPAPTPRWGLYTDGCRTFWLYR